MAKVNLLQGRKILVVDDEPDVLDTLEDLPADCLVESAGSFEEAKDLRERFRYDLADLDIMGVAGYELLKIAADRKIPSVMLTAHTLSPENVVRFFKVRGGLLPP